jgi:hypothetical protein
MFKPMELEKRKLLFIKDVLEVENEETLAALEKLLKSKAPSDNEKQSMSLKNFSGIWTKEEAEEMKRIIESSCEIIHPDDWQ